MPAKRQPVKQQPAAAESSRIRSKKSTKDNRTVDRATRIEEQRTVQFASSSTNVTTITDDRKIDDRKTATTITDDRKTATPIANEREDGMTIPNDETTSANDGKDETATITDDLRNSRRFQDRDRLQMLFRQNWRCLYCEQMLPSKAVQFDHVKAIHKRGASLLTNGCATDPTCHGIKTNIEKMNKAKPGRQPTMTVAEETALAVFRSKTQNIPTYAPASTPEEEAVVATFRRKLKDLNINDPLNGDIRKERRTKNEYHDSKTTDVADAADAKMADAAKQKSSGRRKPSVVDNKFVNKFASEPTDPTIQKAEIIAAFGCNKFERIACKRACLIHTALVSEDAAFGQAQRDAFIRRCCACNEIGDTDKRESETTKRPTIGPTPKQLLWSDETYPCPIHVGCRIPATDLILQKCKRGCPMHTYLLFNALQANIHPQAGEYNYYQNSSIYSCNRRTGKKQTDKTSAAGNATIAEKK
jgi:hypothetical protein